jgi:hypothetical protein
MKSKKDFKSSLSLPFVVKVLVCVGNPLCAKLSGEHRGGSVQFVCAFNFVQSFSVYRTTDRSVETENS